MRRPVGELYGEVRNGKSDRRDFSVPITQEHLNMEDDQLISLLGDEKAQINYRQSYSDKDFGNGFDVSVGLTLTCDQSEDGVMAAVVIAAELVSESLASAVSQAKELDRDIRTS